jgi:hypothetical protein
VRSPPLCIVTFCILLLLAKSLNALTDEEKKRLFLKAREEMHTIPAEPRPTARPKPKPAVRSTPRPTPRPTPEPEPERETPTPTPHATPTPSATPAPSPPVRETPAPHETPKPSAPRETPKPSPTPKPAESRPPAPVVIRKSGLAEDEGEMPTPTPEHRFGWFGLRRSENYRYLTGSVRAEIDRARVKKHRWKFIVVHNSGSRQGNAKIFDYYHRNVRKMPNGLAYHFVIGNGHGSGDGQIEIGDRWRRQINGGHVHSDYLNNIALGICLVGDFNRPPAPSQAQLDACEELIRYLRKRVGSNDEQRQAIVKPHRAINPPRWPTDCPGDRFPYGWFRRF